MKIALVIKEFDPHKGGAERYSCLLARGLLDLGYEVHILANRWEAADPRLVLHHVPMIRWSSLLKVISFPRQVQRIMGTEKFDIVHGLTPLLYQDVYRIGEGLHVDALRLRYPALLARWLRYMNPKHLAVLWIEHRMFGPGNYKKVITNSKMCSERVREIYGIPSSDVNVVYNGVDTAVYNESLRDRHRQEVREQMGVREGETVFLFVSMDFVRKGLSYLLQAHGRLKAEGVGAIKTVVVGKGKLNEYRAMAERLGIGEEVLFVPPTKETERYYAAGDILILPTLYDPFSNVCLEAMACGLPVITTRQNGAAELIENGVNGYVIPHGSDLDALASAIRHTLPGAREMGRTAAKKAAAFTTMRNVVGVEKVYRQIVGAGSLAPIVDERGGIMVNRQFLPLLEAHGLDSFDALMQTSQGESFKDISHRAVARLALTEGEGTRTLYLKRHHDKGVPGERSGGMVEWDFIMKFVRHGIPTMTPVAAGERKNGPVLESILLTDALEGYQRMEIFLRDRYCRPISSELLREKRRIIQKTAALAKKMHKEGFNHRDFYLTHIMIKPLKDGEFDLRIIDLQRVQERKWFRHRWLVKDLAALNFAAKRDYTTRTDRLRFFLAYLGKKTPGKSDKALMRAILAKTRHISAHDASATARKLEYAARANRSATR